MFILPMLDTLFLVIDQLFSLCKLNLAQFALLDPARIPGLVPRLSVRLL